MIHIKQENTFKWLDIEFFKNHKNSKFRLSASLLHCLTTFASLDAKKSILQPQFYNTTTNSPVRCAFWGSDECGASALHRSFYLPLGSSSSFSSSKSYQCVNFSNQDFPRAVHLNSTTSNLKHLCYSRGIG